MCLTICGFPVANSFGQKDESVKGNMKPVQSLLIDWKQGLMRILRKVTAVKPKPFSKNDVIIALCIFIVVSFAGGLVGLQRIENIRNKLQAPHNLIDWYQNYFFRDAIGLATHGSIRKTPALGVNPTYDAFINGDLFTSDTRIPLSELKKIKLEKDYEGRFRLASSHYSITALVAGIWFLSGYVSCGPILFVNAFLLAITACFSYLLFRVVSRSWLAFIFTGLFIFSIPIYNHFSRLRDYSRIPALLLLALFVTMFLKVLYGRYKMAGIAILFGLCFLFLMGFRTDFMFLIPVAVFVLLLFHPGKIFSKKNLISFLLLSGILVTSILIPVIVLNRYSSGLKNPGYGASEHVTGIGTVTYPERFFFQLCPPDYGTFICAATDWGLVNHLNLIQSFRHQTLLCGNFFCEYPEYRPAVREYLKDYLWNQPGEITIRAWNSIHKTLELPFMSAKELSLYRVHISDAEKNFFKRLALQNNQFLSSFPFDPAFLIAAGAFSLLALIRLKAALGGGLFMLAMLTMPIGQFEFRHYFCYGFVSLFLLAMLINILLRVLHLFICDPRKYGRRWGTISFWKKPILRLLIFWGSVAIVAGGSIYSTRAFQTFRMKKILAGYRDIKWENTVYLATPVNQKSETNAQVDLAFPALEELHSEAMTRNASLSARLARYVRVSFCFPRGMEEKDFLVKIGYGGDTAGRNQRDFLCRVRGDGNYALIFPYAIYLPYSTTSWKPSGVQIPAVVLPYVTGAQLVSPPVELGHFLDALWLNLDHPESQSFYSKADFGSL